MSEKNEFLDSPLTNSKHQNNDDEEGSQDQRNPAEDEINQSQISHSDDDGQKKIERKPIPTDKNELIKTLIERLTAAEDAINDAHEALSKEKEKRRSVMKELDEKTKMLNELIKNENESIQTKVQNQFKKTLNAAVAAKVQAEDKKNELEALNIEKDYLVTELDDLILNSRKEYFDLASSYQFLATENYDSRVQIQKLQLERDSLVESNQIKDKTIADLQAELEEAKGTMQKLSDVQNVLNRILGSQDFLTKKDQENLKINPPTNKEGSKVSSTNAKNESQAENKGKLIGNEDDFWYSNNEGGNERYEGKMELNMDQYLNKMAQKDDVNKSINSSKGKVVKKGNN